MEQNKEYLQIENQSTHAETPKGESGSTSLLENTPAVTDADSEIESVQFTPEQKVDLDMISSEDEDEEQDFTNVTNDRTDAKVYSDKKETAKCSSFQPEEELSVQIIPEIICEKSV